MRIHDISVLVEPNMIVWKNYAHKKPIFDIVATHQTGVAHETKMTMDLHCGTHIDMPLHMIKDGKTMDTFDFTRLICSCKVFDMTHLTMPMITSKDIELLEIQENDFVIFKTKNSFRDPMDGFDSEFVFVEESAALALKHLKVNGVGIDAPGIERSQDNHMTHILLLEADIIILEGLHLSHIKEGYYELNALPIKIQGTEASWVRAVLIER